MTSHTEKKRVNLKIRYFAHLQGVSYWRVQSKSALINNVEASLCYFFKKLFHETQILKPPEPTMHHSSIKLLIILPLRADLLCTLQCETPCRIEKIIQTFFFQSFLLSRAPNTLEEIFLNRYIATH